VAPSAGSRTSCWRRSRGLERTLTSGIEIRPDRMASGRSARRARERGADPLGRERKIAQAYAGGDEDRVADRGRRRPLRGFAASKVWLARTVEEHGLDRRHLGKAKDRIRVPVETGDAHAIEAHRFLERPARGLEETSLELAREAGRVDD